MSRTKQVVYIVNNSPHMRKSLRLLVCAEGIEAQAFATAEEFLDSYAKHSKTPKCLVLGLRLKGMGGLQLQKLLYEEKSQIPVIIVTSHGDTKAAVKAMHMGAVDFITTPVNRAALIERIQFALKLDKQNIKTLSRKAKIERRLDTLTDREREILKLTIAGDDATTISSLFDISTKTVLKHRSRILAKMGVETPIELVHLSYRYGLLDK